MKNYQLIQTDFDERVNSYAIKNLEITEDQYLSVTNIRGSEIIVNHKLKSKIITAQISDLNGRIYSEIVSQNN